MKYLLSFIFLSASVAFAQPGPRALYADLPAEMPPADTSDGMVHFKAGETILTPGTKAQLDRFMGRYKSGAGVLLFTFLKEESNVQELGAQMDSVKDYLVEKGISVQLITCHMVNDEGPEGIFLTIREQ